MGTNWKELYCPVCDKIGFLEQSRACGLTVICLSCGKRLKTVPILEYNKNRKV